MKNTLRIFIQCALFVLPWEARRRALNAILGWEIKKTARIGFSLILAEAVLLEKGARIGSLNYVRGLTSLQLYENALIGNLNWITGSMSQFHGASALTLETNSAITNRHYIDCNAPVLVGKFSTVAGVRSQFLTHSIKLSNNRQQAAPITIGDYCFVGSGCILLSGASLPAYCVLGAGSVYSGRKDESPYGLYSGVPAKRVKELDANTAYFSRQEGAVS